MRLNVFLLLFAFSLLGFSQDEKSSIYFPQEQLVHPDCENATDTNKCLSDIIEKDFKAVILEAMHQNGTIKDTLTATVSLQVNEDGKIPSDKFYASVNDSIIQKNFKEELQNVIKNLPRFRVLNKKPDKYFTRHNLGFKYLVNSSKDSLKSDQLIKQKDSNPYAGGTIVEAPVFPGCKRDGESDTRKCFNIKMQEHIVDNFRYPKKARRKGIEGKVHILFVVNQGGFVENIRTKGPHKILEEEAVRIIELLPFLNPGLQNGKPVRIPFAIPITFRLQ